MIDLDTADARLCNSQILATLSVQLSIKVLRMMNVYPIYR